MPEEFASEEYMDFDKLKTKVRHFTRKRDWESFDSPKDLAVAISIEAGEILEVFQWMKENDIEDIKGNNQVRERIKKELEDVIRSCHKMARALDIKLEE